MIKMSDTLTEGRKAVRREDAVRGLNDLLQPLIAYDGEDGLVPMVH
jgi:hypothetical protein